MRADFGEGNLMRYSPIISTLYNSLLISCYVFLHNLITPKEMKAYLQAATNIERLDAAAELLPALPHCAIDVEIVPQTVHLIQVLYHFLPGVTSYMRVQQSTIIARILWSVFPTQYTHIKY